MHQNSGVAVGSVSPRVRHKEFQAASYVEIPAFARHARAIGVALALIFLAISLFTDATDEIWVPEGGVVESATVVAYACCLASMMLQGGLSFLRRHPEVPILTLACLARELDFHKRLTGVSILKIRFFTAPALSPSIKVAGALVILSLTAVCLYALRKYWPAYWAGLRRRAPISIGMTVIGGLVVISKSLDGLNRNFASFGVHLSAAANHIACTLEEILELGVPLLGLLVLQIVFTRFTPPRSGSAGPRPV